MGKAPKGSSSTATKTKAGKKAGSYQEPPAVNKEKQARREAGRQQFFSNEVFTAPEEKIIYNKKTKQFETKIVQVPVPFIWDKDRKDFVFSATREGQKDQ